MNPGAIWHAGETELVVVEPALLPVLRELCGSGRIVTVSALDGSTVKGRVTHLHDDERVVCVYNGEDDFLFDVSMIALVRMAHEETR